MIPSDHFVRFYNEVFKFLDEKGGLQGFYDAISRHQEFHCLENFRQNGIRGVYEYYLKIRKEENCVMEMELTDHYYASKMTRCPSLSKALDNDAGVCKKYCLHCPGWTFPLYRKAGLFKITDLMGLENPQCRGWLFDDLELARKHYRKLAESTPKDQLMANFEVEDTPEQA